MTTRKRRIAGVLVAAVLLVVAITITISPSVRTPVVAAFDEAHYRVWKLGSDHGVDVPMLERQKFDFLCRLIQDTVVPESGRIIDSTTGLDVVIEAEASGVP